MDRTLDVKVERGFLGRRAQTASVAIAAETTRGIVLAQGIHKTYDTGAVKTHALRGVDLK